MSEIADEDQIARGVDCSRSPGAAYAADFSGTWRIDNVFNGASAIITCTLVQAGNALAGSCKPEIPGIAASDLSGTVDGSNAKWGYDVVFNGNRRARRLRGRARAPTAR